METVTKTPRTQSVKIEREIVARLDEYLRQTHLTKGWVVTLAVTRFLDSRAPRRTAKAFKELTDPRRKQASKP